MLESIIFIFLTLLGGLSLLISLIVLIIGLIQKSSKLKKIAFRIGMVPIFCFGILIFWYQIAIPWLNRNQMEDFSGTYVLSNSSKIMLRENGLVTSEIELTLYSEGTYNFYGIEGVVLEKSGIWKTGGIDGLFQFYDQNGNISGWASPSGSGDKSALSIDYQNNKGDLIRSERILFIRK